VCFKEAMEPSFRDYAQQVVENASALCNALKKRKFRMVSGGTENHLMLMDVASAGITGKIASAVLEASGIIANKNTIPFDTNSPFVTSGIRMGTAAVTTRGMKATDMEKIGNWIADALSSVDDVALHAKIKAEIATFAQRFPVP